jgi:hypothetical protein
MDFKIEKTPLLVVDVCVEQRFSRTIIISSLSIHRARLLHLLPRISKDLPVGARGMGPNGFASHIKEIRFGALASSTVASILLFLRPGIR